FFGPFSTGKTSLIEALLGCGGELPALRTATTGNIVQFELRRASVERTAFDQWRARVVDAQDASDMLAGLLRGGRAAMDEETSLRADLPALRELTTKAEDASSYTRWQDACNWARQVAAKAHSRELRRIAFEAYRFARSYETHQRAWAGRTQPLQL